MQLIQNPDPCISFGCNLIMNSFNISGIIQGCAYCSYRYPVQVTYAAQSLFFQVINQFFGRYSITKSQSGQTIGFGESSEDDHIVAGLYIIYCCTVGKI